mgnify:CR=1 FL=1
MSIHLTTTCPRCGYPVLLIAGATFKQTPDRAFVVLCPRCEESSSAKTIVGRVERSKP